MTTNESPTSGSLNTKAIAQQADAALNTLGDKVSDLTGQQETVNKVVTGLQENVLGTQREQSNENQEENTSVAKEDVSTQQVEEFLRHQYRSYKADNEKKTGIAKEEKGVNVESAEKARGRSFLVRRSTASLISRPANFRLCYTQSSIIQYSHTLNALIVCIVLLSIVWNPLEDIMNSYPNQGGRRPSTSTSIHSSKYTDNGFTCPRVHCHCHAANHEEQDPTEPVSLEDSQSQRRRAEYFYRPPVLGPYSGTRNSDDSPYSYFHYEKVSDAEYCEQCQFCWALYRWCGRLPGYEVEKPPIPYQQKKSTAGFTRNQKKMPFPNASWVQEPLIVNAARVSDDNLVPREREQFIPAVFSHTLTSKSLRDFPTRDVAFLREEKNPSLESIRPCRTLSQTSAKDCQRLRFCKDIRGARRDTWAFEEGSLVIGIHPSFVDLNQQLIQEDEFELRYGEVYIICRMFADKWALCARLRMSDTIMPVKHSDLVDHGFENIKFLPLCAVTLAANFASFDRRWSEYRMRCPYASSFPSGGLRVTPPMRCDSLLASIEIAACNFGSLHVPWIVFHLCKPRIPLPPKTEYVPFHLPKRGIGRLIDNTFNGRNTLGRMWRTIVPCEASQSQPLSDNPEIYLEKEVDFLEDDLSSFYQDEPDPTQEDQLKDFNIRGPMKKRKSIRQLFFGSRRYKQLEVTNEAQREGKDTENYMKPSQTV